MRQSVNLIPASTLTLLERKYRIRWWARTWCVSALFLTVISVSIQQARRDSNAQLELAQESVADVRNALRQLEVLQSEIKQASHSVAKGIEIEQSDLPLSLIQAISDQCRTLSGNIQLKSIKLTESTAANQDRPSANRNRATASSAIDLPGHIMQVTLNGVASAEVCTSLVAALRSMSVFRRVDLGSTQTISDDSQSLQSFQIQCDYLCEQGGQND